MADNPTTAGWRTEGEGPISASFLHLALAAIMPFIVVAALAIDHRLLTLGRGQASGHALIDCWYGQNRRPVARSIRPLCPTPP